MIYSWTSIGAWDKIQASGSVLLSSTSLWKTVNPIVRTEELWTKQCKAYFYLQVSLQFISTYFRNVCRKMPLQIHINVKNPVDLFPLAYEQMFMF